MNLERAITHSFTRMTDFIDEWAETIGGIQTKASWEWCYRFYTSYSMCPVAFNHTASVQNNFLVAVYNPSMISLNRTKIAVPHNNFSVHLFNEVSQAFELGESTVLCDDDTNCWLYATHEVLGHSLNFMLVQKNNSATMADTQPFDSYIENDFQTLQYLGYDDAIGQAFLIQKKIYMTAFNIGFELRYYPAYQGFEGTRSGATVFRPRTNESLAYCNQTPSQVYYQNSSIVNQITLVFQCLNGTNATVKARMHFDDPVIEWDIRTDEIPITDG